MTYSVAVTCGREFQTHLPYSDLLVSNHSSPSLQSSDVSDLLTLPGWGGPFDGPWDPLGLSAGATVNDVRRWRESEVTHGRVAMVRGLRAEMYHSELSSLSLSPSAVVLNIYTYPSAFLCAVCDLARFAVF